MTEGQFELIYWRDIKVGDFIKVYKDNEIPADILIVGLPEDKKVCYMQTSNLDGETNLKERYSLDLTTLQVGEKLGMDIITKSAGIIVTDFPNSNIYEINGYLRINDIKSDFSIENTLLRSTQLRNVDYVIGLVIFTGKETKIMKNIENYSPKMSQIDKVINKMMIALISVVLLVTLVISACGYIYRLLSVPDYGLELLNSEYVYFDPNKKVEEQMTIEITKLFVSYYYIFNTIVPISLIINFESNKFIQVSLISKDKELMKDEGDNFKIMNFRIQEDLGSVKYIFTDKTGTLTKNVMKFKDCAVVNHRIGQSHNDSFTQEPNSSLCKSFNKKKILEFLTEPTETIALTTFSSIKLATIELLTNLAVNHDVLTEFSEETAKGSYTGSSPDEVALVKAAAELGIEFLNKTNKEVRFRVGNVIEQFEILRVLKFSSNRGRSSIVIKDSYNNIKVYMKGSDSVILPRVVDLNKTQLKEAKSNINHYAKEGLRTLCFSVKTMSLNEYYRWSELYEDCHNNLSDRRMKELKNKLEEQIETGHAFLGITALEDALQEDVSECLKELMDAGIKIWMITGDKLETAEAIGFSCNMLNESMEIFKIKQGGVAETKKRIEEILKTMEVLEEQDKRLQILESKGEEDIRKDFRKSTIKEFYENLENGIEINNENSQEDKANNVNPFKQYFNVDYEFNEENMRPKINELGFESIIVSPGHSFVGPVRPKQSGFRPMSAGKAINLQRMPNERSIIDFMQENKFFKENDRIESGKEENESINLDRNGGNKDSLDSNKLRQKIKETREKVAKFDKKEEENIFKNYGLIIENQAISSCLNFENRDIFWELAKNCKTVICCRCLPIQKAEIVSYVGNKSNSTTLAIGDGGNDVNMIKAANVGVGIFGKEGHQAAFNSDYAFSQFKYLKRLIFKHGRYSLLQNSYFLYIYMHKNIVFSLPQLYFAFFSGFSGSVYW